MNFFKLLLNPFTRFGGAASLLIALLVMAIAVVVSNITNSHFDGIIDLHMSPDHPVTWTIAVIEWGIDWLMMVLLLYVAALILSPSSVRLVDVAGMQGMARFPLVLAALLSGLPVMDKLVSYAEKLPLDRNAGLDLTPTDVVMVILIVSVSLACIVWTVSLMYKAYSVSCNLRGARGIVSFIVVIVLAEILSKIIFSNIIL